MLIWWLKTSSSSLPDEGVKVPLNKALGSNSNPRFFLTDLRFLFENPKEWADSKGSFRFEEGVPPTGVAEENTGKHQRRIKNQREIVFLAVRMSDDDAFRSLSQDMTGFNIHLSKSKIKQPGNENKSSSKQMRRRVNSFNQNYYQEDVGCKEIGFEAHQEKGATLNPQ